MQSNQVVKIKVTKLTSDKWHHHSQSPKRTDMVSIDSIHMRIVAVGDLIWQHRLSQPFLFLLSKAENIWLDFSFPRFLASRQWRSQGSGHSLSHQIPQFEFNTVLASTINFANHFQVYKRTQSNLPKHTIHAGQTRSRIWASQNWLILLLQFWISAGVDLNLLLSNIIKNLKDWLKLLFRASVCVCMVILFAKAIHPPRPYLGPTCTRVPHPWATKDLWYL